MIKKYALHLLSIVILVLLFGVYLISQNETNKITKIIKDNTPTQIKQLLKKTLFYIPLKIREYKEIKKAFYELNDKNLELITENNVLKNQLYQGDYDKNVKGEYIFQSFVVPFISDDDPYKRKSQAYLEIYKEKIIIIFWSGKILYLDKDNFDKEISLFTEIKNNLIKENFFNNSIKWTGVRDALVVDDVIYLSLAEEIKKDCYMTSVIKANLNFENLEFSSVFKPKECTDISNQVDSFKYFNGHQTGGRLVWLDEKIYLTIGDYNSWEYVQDNKSVIGKILEIDPNTESYRIISKGHRNQQGLAIFSQKEKLLISSEHGPKGGDEINIIDLKRNLKTNNFGWPIASYGEHYDVVPINKYTKKYAPLHKSHKGYGFQEPIKFFPKAVAPSQIIKNYFTNENQFILSSLGKESLFFLEIDNSKNVKLVNTIDTGERIRDIIYDKFTNSYFIYQEKTNTPKIVKISKIK